MNPPTAEAIRPINPPLKGDERQEVIATLINESGAHIPITKKCVQLIFVQERSYLDHCLVTLEGEKTFLQPSEETLQHLLDSGVVPGSEADIAVETISLYASYMSKRHGSEPLPELIPAEGLLYS